MDNLTRMAIRATLHCLVGCAIGEILGMSLGALLGWSSTLTVLTSIGLAFFFGYIFTITPVMRSGVPLVAAIKITIMADSASILVMEIVDNTILIAIPGAMDAGLRTLLFWGSLAASLFIAFWVTIPLNRFLISRGLGHAIVHHSHGSTMKASHTPHTHDHNH